MHLFTLREKVLVLFLIFSGGVLKIMINVNAVWKKRWLFIIFSFATIFSVVVMCPGHLVHEEMMKTNHLENSKKNTRSTENLPGQSKMREG